MMLGKRKRKRPNITNECQIQDQAAVVPAVLETYYPQVSTLRSFIYNRLSPVARSRLENAFTTRESLNGTSLVSVNQLLDNTVVGVSKDISTDVKIRSQIQVFLADGFRYPSQTTQLHFTQSELVDLAIYRLFFTIYPPGSVYKPPHQLCYGFQRSVRETETNSSPASGIPGIVSRYPNIHVSTMKSSGWSELYELLSSDGPVLMLDLLLNCGIYYPTKNGKGNYYQVSGTPLYEIQPFSNPPLIAGSVTLEAPMAIPDVDMTKTTPTIRSPTQITFVRNRILYSRPALNPRGAIRFGFKHIHVLSRYGNPSNPAHTSHVMKYIFPRQFGLHNVFTSNVDSRETVQLFKDYTLREPEITALVIKEKSAAKEILRSKKAVIRTPKRLRGEAFEIVRRLQRNNSRCAYARILNYYCPVSEKSDSLDFTAILLQPQVEKEANIISTELNLELAATDQLHIPESGLSRQSQNMTDHATPVDDVSAFCRAILKKLLPKELFGIGEIADTNRNIILHNVDVFLKLRKFETLSLHEVLQGLNISSMEWLSSDKITAGQKSSQSETKKRMELLQEILYYLFDSILIPLIRAHFHVTETNSTKNKLFFFRHDVWKKLSEPALDLVKATAFEELNTTAAESILKSRVLGFGQLRLLPKTTGFRTIMNLRRREASTRYGRITLGRSINSVMKPVHNFLTYEKSRQPERFGSAMFSVGEMFPRLRKFRDSLELRGLLGEQLYFAKVDVTSCFDTIPPEKLLNLVEDLSKQPGYRFERYVEIRGPEGGQYSSAVTGKPRRRFINQARGSNEYESFKEKIENEVAQSRRETIFVDQVVPTTQSRNDLLKLLRDHVQQNIVKIDKTYYRQKTGIPQGSVISTVACNFFYADFERNLLAFIDPSRSLLLRLIDDFLLITLDKEQATQFLDVTHQNHSSYGFSVNVKKSLTNFPYTTESHPIKHIPTTSLFPYCGNLISTDTLAISKDHKQPTNIRLADSLTVSHGAIPGRTFYRKILAAFKIQVHPMLTDTAYNGRETVLKNLSAAFIETAEKMYAYMHSLGPRCPKSALIEKTMIDLAETAAHIVKSRSRGAVCNIAIESIRFLCYSGLLMSLQRRQTKFQDLVTWLREQKAAHEPRNTVERRSLIIAEKQAIEGFKDI